MCRYKLFPVSQFPTFNFFFAVAKRLLCFFFPTRTRKHQKRYMNEQEQFSEKKESRNEMNPYVWRFGKRCGYIDQRNERKNSSEEADGCMLYSSTVFTFSKNVCCSSCHKIMSLMKYTQMQEIGNVNCILFQVSLGYCCTALQFTSRGVEWKLWDLTTGAFIGFIIPLPLIRTRRKTFFPTLLL